MEDTELDSSELGTHSYWQKAYTKEIANFDDHGDTGDVWFGEDSADRVINWICKCDVDKDAAIIDLGCGNGYTLSELAKEGFTNLLGVDYCREAIELAEKVSKKEFPFINYKLFDITKDSVSCLGRRFALIHDKGTYDAICLNPDSAKEHRLKYIEQVADMAGDQGYIYHAETSYILGQLLYTTLIQISDNRGLFMITSCNWTEEELKSHFSEKFDVKAVIPTPQFKFGGKVGSVVSSVVFVKK